MHKLLIICGPTGTGKTALAIKLAEKYNGEIVSADSRQVYRGMDIGTGKDVPPEFKKQSVELRISGKKRKIDYYSDGKTSIWGYDLVDPDEDFSVTDFVRFAKVVIFDIQKRGKLPIIVGGTGLYLRALLGKLPDIYIPRDLELRKRLYKLSVEELQAELQQTDLQKYAQMNDSDRNNPRRLVRAIEIAMSGEPHPIPLLKKEREQEDVLKIGLTAPKEELERRIEKRVKQRIKNGMMEEIESLLAKGYSWDLPSMSALGYRLWKDYFEHKIGATEITQKWLLEEQQYSKRQLTWLKKEPQILWFDILENGYSELIMQEVQKWYNYVKT